MQYDYVMPRQDTVTLKLPMGIIKIIDDYMKQHPEYVNRSDLVKECIRMHLRTIKE